MTTRLSAASLWVSAIIAASTVPGWPADYLDIRHEHGSSKISGARAETTITTAQQTIAGEPRRTGEPKIVRVSVPVDSSDGPSWSYDAKVWRTDFPIRDANQIGIGYIIEPEPANRIWSPADFVMHDHMYLADGVPDPRRANITYYFSEPARVSEVLIIQHTNGIGQIEGFIGDDENHMLSIGHANSTMGANLPLKENTFTEGYHDVFKFERVGEGKVFRIVITKTPLPNGYALYRVYPRNNDHRAYERFSD
jgi:hypothetical protein